MGWIEKIRRKTANKHDPLQDELLDKADTMNHIYNQHNDMIKTVELFEDLLSSVIKLDKFKLYLRGLAKGAVFNDIRGDVGIDSNSIIIPPMMFVGDSGTGKSLAAKLLGRLLSDIGRLGSSRVTEVGGLDLVGIDAAGTVLRTQQMMYDAKPGILVVNEVHRLISLSKDHAILALQEIKNRMGEYGIVPIFTSPRRRIKQEDIAFIASFFRERLQVFWMTCYSPKELAQIAHLKMKSQEEGSPIKGFKFHPECTVGAMTTLFESYCNPLVLPTKRFNVDIVLERARIELEARLSFGAKEEDLISITLNDVKQALFSESNQALFSSVGYNLYELI